MKISYNWLQDYFEEKLPKPNEVAEGIIFHAFEVEEIEERDGDIIFDIKVLPDRAHDCLSHWGIAKEISAIFNLRIKYNIFENFESNKTDLEIEIKNSLNTNGQDKCPRYMGRIIRNITVKESPEWLKNKLKMIGQKPINNIVDAANFVMFDLGQPIHCFDLDKLESSKIIVRNGEKGEKINTLDHREVELDESILIIADEKDPLAIAGIKGGTKAEVDLSTKNIVIEVANFDQVSTRKTSKKVGIYTDAVKRYENGISPELCQPTMNQISDLIYKLAGGEVEKVIDVYPQKQPETIINIRVDYINKRLGSNFTKEEIKKVWDKLNFEYSQKGEDFEIRIPFLRLDILGPHDLVEEVIRILGYDRLEEKLPHKITQNKDVYIKSLKDSNWIKTSLARYKLLEDGYSEVMTYVFRDKGDLEVLASASGKNFLRNNLSDGLSESIKLNQLNLPLLDIDNVKVFEIGTVFFKEREEIHVAFGDKKKIIEKTLDEFLGEISPEYSDEYFLQLVGYYMDPQVESDLVGVNPDFKTFKQWSIYPFIYRDIAVWVPEGIEAIKLVEIYKSFGTELLIKEPKLFDSFTKDGKTSFAYRLVFQSYDRTLTDEEINQIMSKITEKITSLGWQVR